MSTANLLPATLPSELLDRFNNIPVFSGTKEEYKEAVKENSLAFKPPRYSDSGKKFNFDAILPPQQEEWFSLMEQKTLGKLSRNDNAKLLVLSNKIGWHDVKKVSVEDRVDKQAEVLEDSEEYANKEISAEEIDEWKKLKLKAKGTPDEMNSKERSRLRVLNKKFRPILSSKKHKKAKVEERESEKEEEDPIEEDNDSDEDVSSSIAKRMPRDFYLQPFGQGGIHVHIGKFD